MVRRIYDNELDKLRDLFVGKSVTKADERHLELSDGTELLVSGNEGCGGCSAGWYSLEELNDCPNIITNVEVEVEDHDDGVSWHEQKTYRLFVFAENQKINLATFEGDDGNGYYGSGFWVKIEEPT